MMSLSDKDLDADAQLQHLHKQNVREKQRGNRFEKERERKTVARSHPPLRLFLYFELLTCKVCGERKREREKEQKGGISYY